MSNLKPLVLDPTNTFASQISDADTLVIPKADATTYPLISNMPRFEVIDTATELPTADGYYLFAGEPTGGFPTGITSAGGIAKLASSVWLAVFTIDQIPDVAIEVNGDSWVKNPTLTGWMAYKNIDDTITDNESLWSSSQISAFVTQSLLNTPSLPPVKFATTTNDSKSGLTARDGYTPVIGDVALVKNQTNNDNGFFIVSAASWARAKYNEITNAFEPVTTETTYEALNIQGGIVNVLNGTANKNAQFQINIANEAAIFENSIVYVTNTTKIPIAGANTRYIDAGSGNNSFNGSAAFPFATLTAAYNSAGLSFPSTFFLPASGAPLSDAITHVSGKSNIAIVTLDHTQKGGKTALTGVQTFATGNTRVTFKGMTFATGSAVPLVFESGNLFRHEFENVSFSGTYTNFMSLPATATNWISIRNCDFTSAANAALQLPVISNTQAPFSINVYDQNSRLPISGVGRSDCVIHIYNSDDSAVRVYPSFVGYVAWHGKAFSSIIGSQQIQDGIITSQAQLDTVLAWTTDESYDGYYAISGFDPTTGKFQNGAIFGKKTAAGIATEVFWARTYNQAPTTLGTFSGKVVARQARDDVLWVFDKVGIVGVSVQVSSATKPTNPASGDSLIVTSDGTSAGTVQELWVYDGSAWIQTVGSTPVSGSVINNTITDSTAIETVGRYIVPATGTSNEFLGQENNYADYDGSTFSFAAPADLDQVIITSGTNAGQTWKYTASNTTWAQVAGSALQIFNWDYTASYAASSVVVYNNNGSSSLFQAIQEVPANTNLDREYWKPVDQFVNLLVVTIPNLTSNQLIGTAADTVDAATQIIFNQTTANITPFIPNPTNTAANRLILFTNAGTVNVRCLGQTLEPTASVLGMWNGSSYAVVGTKQIVLQASNENKTHYLTFSKDLQGNASTLNTNDTLQFNPNTKTLTSDNVFANIYAENSLDIADLSTGGLIGTAANTVDVYSTFNIEQTTPGQSLSLPAPTVTTLSRTITVVNSGTVEIKVLGTAIGAGSFGQYTWNASSWYPETTGSSMAYSASILSPRADASGIATTQASATTILTYNIPSAGTWRIDAGVVIQKASVTDALSVWGLWNSSSVLVPNTLTLAGYAATSPALVLSSFNNFIVTTSGPETYTIRAYGTSGSLLRNNATFGFNTGKLTQIGSAPISSAILTTKASGFVHRGTDITLGNLKARWSASGNMNIQLSTVSGTYLAICNSMNNKQNVLSGSTNSAFSITTTPASPNSSDIFGTVGDTSTWIITDNAQGVAWKVTGQTGASLSNNFLMIEQWL